MNSLLSLLFLFAAVLVVRGFYDCRRPGQACKNGGCDYGTGVCACSDAEMSGSDCGLNSTLVVSSGCNPPCQNNGTCTEPTTGNFECYCPVDYTGSSCEFNRLIVECTGKNYTVTVRPYGTFTGRMFIQPNNTDSECQLTQIGTSGMWENTFDLNETCSVTTKEDTPSTGDTTFERDVFIQYNTAFVSSVDQLITTSCIHTTPDADRPFNGSVGAVGQESGNFEQSNVDVTYDPIVFEVQTGAGTALPSTIVVGSPLQLYFTLKDKEVYDNLIVEDCFCANGLSGTKYRRLQLIEDSCIAPTAMSILRNPPMTRNQEKPEVLFNFRSFKFDFTNQVLFTCKIRICKPGDSLCNEKPSCNIPGGFGRRKRSAPSTSGSSELYVAQSIRVVEASGQIPDIPADQPKGTASCFMRAEILTVVVTLAVVLAAMVFVCTFLLCRMFRTRSSSSSKMADDCQSSYSSSMASHLHIPRVKPAY